MNLQTNKGILLPAVVITISYIIWMWSNYENARLAREQFKRLQQG